VAYCSERVRRMWKVLNKAVIQKCIDLIKMLKKCPIPFVQARSDSQLDFPCRNSDELT
jgi:hypothetical protein